MSRADEASARPRGWTGGVSWRWSEALWAAAGMVPIVFVIASGRVSTGVAAAVGLLPVGLLGIPDSRRKRVVSAVVGCLFAAFVLVGSAISEHEWLAVAGMLVVPLLASLLAARSPLGRLALALVVPAVAVGLSFHGVSEAGGLAAAIACGAIWMAALSLAWPAVPVPGRPPPAPLTLVQARRWGLLLGGAAATATLIGEVSGFAHLGWAPTAALLVMRPQRDLLTQRGIGRVIATVAGAAGAALLLELDPGDLTLAGAVALAVVATVATRTSRAYVASAGTSFLVLTLLLYGQSTAAVHSTFAARVGASLVGVGLAYLFGVVLAGALAERRREQQLSDRTISPG